MLRIDNNNVITVVTKDTGSISFSVDNYTLKQGDKVTFTVAPDLEMRDYTIQKVVTAFDKGVAEISLTTTDTDKEVGTYYYDIQVNRGDGQVDTIIGPAKFKIVGGVTY